MAKSKGVRLGNKARGRQISSNKAKYERQWFRTERNRLKKLRKHIDRHPNDLPAQSFMASLNG